MDFREVQLEAPAGTATDLRSFYLDLLGLEGVDGEDQDLVDIRVGASLPPLFTRAGSCDALLSLRLLDPG